MPANTANVSGEPVALLSTTSAVTWPSDASSNPMIALLPVTTRHVTGPVKIEASKKTSTVPLGFPPEASLCASTKTPSTTGGTGNPVGKTTISPVPVAKSSSGAALAGATITVMIATAMITMRRNRLIAPPRTRRAVVRCHHRCLGARELADADAFERKSFRLVGPPPTAWDGRRRNPRSGRWPRPPWWARRPPPARFAPGPGVAAAGDRVELHAVARLAPGLDLARDVGADLLLGGPGAAPGRGPLPDPGRHGLVVPRPCPAAGLRRPPS